MQFAKTVTDTPVLNRSDFAQFFSQSRVWDDSGHIRFLETILLPGTALEVIDQKEPILQVVTDEYPSENPLYIDSRFVECSSRPFPARVKKKYTEEEMVKALIDLEGFPYLLGGTVDRTLLLWADLYPPPEGADPFTLRHWVFDGIDCSGLIYFVADGALPRNTSQLYHFGKAVDELKPLDIIVWPGHMFVALDEEYVIESREFDGVVITKWQDRREEIAQYAYKVRRWVDQIN